jgi:hypothetical protein
MADRVPASPVQLTVHSICSDPFKDVQQKITPTSVGVWGNRHLLVATQQTTDILYFMAHEPVRTGCLLHPSNWWI